METQQLLPGRVEYSGGGGYLDDGVLGRRPGRHDLAVQPPRAVGVDQVSLYDQVLQHVLGLLLAAQHQPPEAVVDGQSLGTGTKRHTHRSHDSVSGGSGHQDVGLLVNSLKNVKWLRPHWVSSWDYRCYDANYFIQ